MSFKVNRILALSDLHVDVPENREWIMKLSKADYREDVIIVAGDVSDQIDRLTWTFETLLSRFAGVFYVPGNHELWVKSHQTGDSLQKFFEILNLCQNYGVQISPAHLFSDDEMASVWIVPVFTWYQQPEDGDQGLYIPNRHGGEDKTEYMWRDNVLVRWPESQDLPITAAEFFLDYTSDRSEESYSGNVITFSHFLPNKTVMFPTEEEKIWREEQGYVNPHPEFNFSRVAGFEPIDQWIRQRGSNVHIYGHQHRNRTIELNGLTYVSHCLGYPRERDSSLIGRDEVNRPKTIWQAGKFLL